MGQIEKRKKKGRPSKADLASRLSTDDVVSPSPEKLHQQQQQQEDRRRSLRRRSFRYSIIDYDEDYLNDDVLDFDDEEYDDDDDGDGDEDERSGGKKKVKLVVKLENNSSCRRKARSNRVDSVSRRGRVEVNESSGSSDEEEEEEEEVEERREVKKRRINNNNDDEDADEDDDVDFGENDEDEGDDGKKGSKRSDSVPGTPSYNNHCVTHLPDKKLLELILDKLQKKDTYGVYAEPVDPDELPDYHDIIVHPMDFSTVRKKLANGSYSTLEQFEADVFLISANAMQYNAPDTIYHKQARAIKEAAEKKFQRIRLHIGRLEKEPKSEPKCEPKSEPKPGQKSEPKPEPKSELRERSNSLVKKQSKKPICRNLQEPVVSDFSSGTTLATADTNNNCSTDPVGKLEKLNNNDGLAEGISFLVDNHTEKAEDLQSGKGILPKFGKRSFLVDENRRATYNISCQPIDRSESISTPFDDEKKQLIQVGLPGDHSYARSLARYAANLGPIAWQVASKKIEQVLPPGLKFGCGWIGEYEPLPTVVIFEGRKEHPLVSRSHVNVAIESRNNEKHPDHAVQRNVESLNQPSLDGKPTSIFGSGIVKPPIPMVSVPQQKNPPSRGSGGPENMMVKRVELNCLSTSDQKNIAVFQQQNRPPRVSVCPENMGAKRVEPNSPSSYNQKTGHTASRQPSYGVEMGVNRSRPNSPSIGLQKTDHGAAKATESYPKGKNFLQSLPFKQPDANGSTNHDGLQNGNRVISSSPGLVPAHLTGTTSFHPRQDQGVNDGLQNGNRVISSSPGLNPTHLTGATTSFPQKQQDQGVNDGLHNGNRLISSSPGLIPTHLPGATTSFTQRQDQGVNDPVLVMKMLTEKAQSRQNGSLSVQARPSVPSPRGDSGRHATVAAANAWMSAGYKPPTQSPSSSMALNSLDPYGTRMFYPQAVQIQPRAEHPVSTMMHFQPDKKGFPFQAFGPQSVNEPQVSTRPMVFPQMVSNDLSRFQVQSSWRGLSAHTQQKQKQETLPPDLNVAFQSVDSQQPDLALQL